MQWFIRVALLALGGCPVVGCAVSGPRTPEAPPMPEARRMVVPRYTTGGELVRPVGYETWVFVGASIGLSYSEGSKSEGPGVFHNVYMQTEAYEQYARTGEFPEKTMFILALHEPRQRESINKQGYFQGGLVALEAAVKDQEHFKEGWAYFDFGERGLDASAPAKPPAACHACHEKHAADDNVFVQFYPPLRLQREARKAAIAGSR